MKSFTLAKTTQNPIKSQLGFLENQDRGSRIEDKGSRIKNLIEFFFSRIFARKLPSLQSFKRKIRLVNLLLKLKSDCENCILCSRLSKKSFVGFHMETKIVRATSSAKAFFEVVDVLVEGFSLGVNSQKT